MDGDKNCEEIILDEVYVEGFEMKRNLYGYKLCIVYVEMIKRFCYMKDMLNNVIM